MIKFKPENLNDTTRRFPRTLYEAFPHSPEPTFDRTDKAVMAVCGFAWVFLMVLLAMGY